MKHLSHPTQVFKKNFDFRFAYCSICSITKTLSFPICHIFPFALLVEVSIINKWWQWQWTFFLHINPTPNKHKDSTKQMNHQPHTNHHYQSINTTQNKTKWPPLNKIFLNIINKIRKTRTDLSFHLLFNFPTKILTYKITYRITIHHILL